MNNSDEPSSALPRTSCSGRLPVRIAKMGEPGTIAGTMISANTRKRSQAISTEGSVADRYFEVTSEVPRNTVDNRISAIPLNGRSARAGALRASRLSSGNFSSGNATSESSSLAATTGISRGNDGGARSSLMAAAGGGVTANLDGNSNQVRSQK